MDGAVIGLSSLAGVEAIDAAGFSGVKVLLTSAADSLDLTSVTVTGAIFINAGSENDIVSGSAGDDTIGGGKRCPVGDRTNLTDIEAIEAGGFGGFKLVGTSAAETLDFSAIALSGATLVNAGSGNDTVLGSAGGDAIAGGAGADLLSGGDGADAFVFTAVSDSRGTAVDTIGDWQDGLDIIDLAAIDANNTGAAAGDQAFGFASGGTFSRTAGELIAQVVAGDTHVLGDTNGDGRANFTIRLTGGAFSLDASDFVL